MIVGITGGTGFIGRALTEHLTQLGHGVRIFSRNPDRRVPLPDAVELVRWSTEPEDRGWYDATSDLDAIIHLAGEQVVGRRWTAVSRERITQSRVGGVEALLSAMAATQSRVQVMICASGVGYYGARSAADELGEEEAPGTDFLAELCVAWERATAPASALGVRVVNARLGIVLGSGGGALSTMALPFRLGIGGSLGDGQQMVSWVHLDDVVRQFAECLCNSSLAGPMNFTAPRPVNNEVLSAEIARALKRPCAFRVPEWALKLRFGESAFPILTGQCALPKRFLRANFEWRFPEVSPALGAILRPGISQAP
ncbi:MAG: TIGR01777 family protein [Polyangiaceae bacterium]|nr:TIGR01777 family protein [Polyangiaceae bacterium]